MENTLSDQKPLFSYPSDAMQLRAQHESQTQERQTCLIAKKWIMAQIAGLLAAARKILTPRRAALLEGHRDLRNPRETITGIV
jgi:hypothetical protein